MNEKRYFQWLCQRINPTARPYYLLLHEMYNTRFTYTLYCPLDENRAEDGKALRKEYINSASDYLSYAEARVDANILEVLVALADNIDDILAEAGDEHPESWFWTMVSNLRLIRQKDGCFDREYTQNVLRQWVKREYDVDGKGGLFPLRHPIGDQRFVDIWDQAAAYINENEQAWH